MKYILSDTTKEINGRKCYQIECVNSFLSESGIIVRGEFGGFVESDSILSHEDNSWIDVNSSILGTSSIFNSFVENSFLDSVSLKNSMIKDSTIINGIIFDTKLVDSELRNSKICNSFLQKTFIQKSTLSNVLLTGVNILKELDTFFPLQILADNFELSSLEQISFVFHKGVTGTIFTENFPKITLDGVTYALSDPLVPNVFKQFSE